MEKRSWDNIGIQTSLLGFGAMRLKTIDGEIDRELGFKLFDNAIKAGVNYFDTAIPYTNQKNEKFVGEALKRYPRESFYLATKFSLFTYQTREDALNSIDKQLENLQTDYIDFYLVHALNESSFQKFKDWNLLEVLLEWKRLGKIRHIGFSFHDKYLVFKEILNYYDWEFCQIQLNYMDTEFQQGITGYYDLVSRNIPVVIMEPLKGGKLVSFNDEVKQIFNNYNSDSPARWALRYVGSLLGVKVILSGMREESDLEDNIETFKNFKLMNDDEYKVLTEVRGKLLSLIKVACTDCKYCMPCPNQVDIPANFKMYNSYGMYQNEGDLSWNYNSLKKQGKLFTNCSGCGNCCMLCPQKIDIISEFENMQADLSEFIKKNDS